jgi:hypothetical protein
MSWYRPFVTVVGLVGMLGVGGAALAQCGPPQTPIQLVVPQSTATTVLRHWCGGIQEQSFASGFDAATGYPIGDVYLKTVCSAGKGTSTTYKAWVATMWDFTGALVSYTTLSSTPSTDPALSVYDAHGNQLYNQSNRAYVLLAAGFVPAPRVATVTPSSGPQGSTVTITGTAFSGATHVAFGTLAAANFTVTNDTSITAITPGQRTGSVDVSVTTLDGGASANNSNDRFTFLPTPRVASISPTQGSADGGTTVTISGVNFTGTTAVDFGGVPATIIAVTDTSITATSPPGPDSGVTVDVTVTSSNGTSATSPTDRYTYT